MILPMIFKWQPQRIRNQNIPSLLDKNKGIEIVFSNHFSNENNHLSVLNHDIKYQKIQKIAHSRLPETRSTDNFKIKGGGEKH